MTTIFFDKNDYNQALKLARGCYQKGLIRGTYGWSGADLAGNAKHWSSRYALSRNNLLSRLSKNFEIYRITGKHGKIYMFVGSPYFIKLHDKVLQHKIDLLVIKEIIG